MTDPVDTDALRARADDDEALGYPEAARELIAFADEVDRLRAELKARDERTGMEITFRHTVEQKYDRLRAVIEHAPHAPECASNDWGDDNELSDARPCTCWKADVL